MIPRRTEVAVSTFNLYKGGSLALYRSFSDDLASRRDVVEIAFSQPARSRSDRRLELRYPVSVLNFVYRLTVEQLLVPIIALRHGARRLVMFGNFPALLWWRPQTIFFHNTLYLDSSPASPRFRLEQWLFRVLVRLKRPRVAVQTAAVARAFQAFFGGVAAVEVVGVPAPIGPADVPNRGREAADAGRRLIYPAHPYPHKNHAFLARCAPALREAGFRVVLTIARDEAPPDLRDAADVFECVGTLPRAELLQWYARCDGMVFPSSSESLGLPLLEAAQLGLPIVAPDLPYVRAAIDGQYEYPPERPDGFARALATLRADLDAGRARPARSAVPVPANDFNDRVLA